MSIRPELVAGKIESGWLDHGDGKHQYTRRQINELLWFLQWRSARNDGLDGLVNELLSRYPDAFGNRAMVKIGAPKDGCYSLEQCLSVWLGADTRSSRRAVWIEADTRNSRPYECENEEREERQLAKSTLLAGRADRRPCFDDFCGLFLDPQITVAKVQQGTQYDREVVLRGLKLFNWQYMAARYRNEAGQKMARHLHGLCVDKSADLYNPSYCPNLVKLLFDHMDHCAGEVAKSIAQTEVTRRVFKELDFACSQNVPVPIIGESRIGKTSPAAAWCAMRPGRARLVTVPESNRMRDFMEAHADAFGIEHSPTITTAALTSAVKYVHQHSGLMAVYDEAAFLVPVHYSQNTPPARINFVRCQVIDRGLPCAFFATPQSYKQTLQQYSQVTARKMTEWLGRLAPAVILPPDLDSADMMQVARIHFPDLPEPFLKLIIARAMQSEGYLKNLEFAAKRALFNAQQSVRSQPSIEDVRLAIEEMMPHAPAPSPAPRPVRTAAAVPPSHRRAGAEAVPLPGSAPARFDIDRPLQATTAP